MESARKQRLLVLDAMRGVAAYIVVLHHAFPADANPARAGYLAVDFFFVLSGFVMSQAYEERFRNGLRLKEFALARVLRLAPPMWIGILLGAVVSYSMYHDPVAAALIAVPAFLCLPLLSSSVGVFPLDSVQWSLFFELAANAAHAKILWRLPDRMLAAVALSCLIIYVLGSYRLGSTSVGDQTATFLLGFARVGFGYVTGILLHRLHGRIPRPELRGDIPVVALVFIVGLVSQHDRWGTEILATLLMPALVLTGARSTTSVPRLCEYLGRLSFPVYAVHAPILVMCLASPPALRVPIVLGATTIVAALVDFLSGPQGQRRLRLSWAPGEAARPLRF